MNKKIIFFGLLLSFVFVSHAFASLTFTTNAITGTTASTIDLGVANTLSLQTTSNGNIITGTGNFGIANTSPGELLTLGLAGTTKGVFSLSGNTSGKIIIQPAAAAGTYTLTLPTTAGTLNQVLTTDGTGVLSWATSSGGGGVSLQGSTPGTPDTGNINVSGAVVAGTTISIPTTTSSTTGVIYKGSTQFIHNFALAGTTGFNTFVGFNAGNFTMTGSTSDQGSRLTAVGRNVLQSNTTGYQNTGVGNTALSSNTTGFANTALGNSALFSNTTGASNIAIGNLALFDLNITDNSSNNNIAIGVSSGRGIVTGINNTILGSNVTGLAAGLSGNIIIADGLGNQRINVNSSGNVGIGTGTSPNANAILDVSSTTKAFMPPRMTTTQRDAIAIPTAGMVIYNTTTNKLNVYTTTWEAVTSS